MTSPVLDTGELTVQPTGALTVELVLGRPDVQLADVDAAVAARQCDGEGGLETDGQVEVAREQVAGARRQDAQWCLRADGHAGHVAHGAVAAEGAHDVDTLEHGGGGLAGSGSSAVVSRKTGSPQPLSRQLALIRSRTGAGR